jgi:hypothetical protein
MHQWPWRHDNEENSTNGENAGVCRRQCCACVREISIEMQRNDDRKRTWQKRYARSLGRFYLSSSPQPLIGRNEKSYRDCGVMHDLYILAQTYRALSEILS